jgi:16S rRNA (cytidine1402-2'-O)-methyltransferase
MTLYSTPAIRHFVVEGNGMKRIVAFISRQKPPERVANNDGTWPSRYTGRMRTLVRSASGTQHSRKTNDPPGRHYVLNGQPVVAPPLASGLHVVATPIGNLRDVTVRALEVLAAAELIACEDTRISRKLLNHYGIGTPLTPYHEHNATEARPKLIARLAQGCALALVSDAGTPLVSDPGYRLVRAAREAGHAVMTAPGPSSVLAALTISGLPTNRFCFEGFLPVKGGQRRSRITELDRIPATLVLFESGPRIAASLADLAAGLGNREAAICRELTKLHEEVRRGELGTLAADYAGAAETRGEFVIVIAPPLQTRREAANLDALLQPALDRLSLKEAVAETVAVTGLPRRQVYQRALALAKDRDHDR